MYPPHRPFFRSSEKAEKLRQLGGHSRVSTLDNTKLIEDGTSASDVVISAANVGHLNFAEALLRGLKRRLEVSRHRSIYINTSGTTMLTSDARGSRTTYDHATPARIKTSSATSLLTSLHTAGYAYSYS
ncbi:hypothetical protein EV122DRAFT_273839 [Schizophyllum commune]